MFKIIIGKILFCLPFSYAIYYNTPYQLYANGCTKVRTSGSGNADYISTTTDAGIWNYKFCSTTACNDDNKKAIMPNEKVYVYSERTDWAGYNWFYNGNYVYLTYSTAATLYNVISVNDIQIILSSGEYGLQWYESGSKFWLYPSGNLINSAVLECVDPNAVKNK